MQKLVASKAARWKNRTFEVFDREALTAIAGYQMNDTLPRPFI